MSDPYLIGENEIAVTVYPGGGFVHIETTHPRVENDRYFEQAHPRLLRTRALLSPEKARQLALAITEVRREIDGVTRKRRFAWLASLLRREAE